MAVLVAGGAGFIGLNIAERLLRVGDSVILLDRIEPPPQACDAFDTLRGRWTMALADVTDASEVARVFDTHPVDRVFYGAAVTSGALRERAVPEQVMAVNVLGLTHVLKCAARVRVKRFINISSGSAYGEGGFATSGAVAPLDEDRSRPLPGSLYSVSKFAGEGICRRYAALTGIDAFSVRLSTIFGPWERDSGSRDTLSTPMQAAILATRGQTIVVGRQDSKDWTYSRDVADALAALMSVREHRFDLYNISAERVCSVLDITAALAEEFPGLRARLAQRDEQPNVSLHGDTDRLAMSSRRLRVDTGFSVRSELSSIAHDFAEWIRQYPSYWHVNASGAVL